MRLLVTVAIVLASAAGCVDEPETRPAEVPVTVPPADLDLAEEPAPSPAVPRLAQRANLTVDGGVTIHFNGTGWGRLTITAGGSLPVRVLHQEWDDLAIFSDDGAAVYDDGLHHTFVIFGEPRSMGADESFRWQYWGTPGWASWPSGNAGDTWDHTTLSFPEGSLLNLVVATSVEGYSFQIGDGARELTWDLGPHPGLHVTWPDPTDDALVDEAVVEVQRERHWAVAWDDQPPSYLQARAYTRSDGAIEAGTEADALGWRTGPSEGPSTVLRFPTYTVSANSYSSTTLGGIVADTVDLEVYRTLVTDKVKAMEKQEHAGFAAVPLE